MENSTQKVTKLSILSSSFSESMSEDSIDEERTPQYSISPHSSEILNLISILQLALNDQESFHSSVNDLEHLKSLVSRICTEYLKLTQNAPTQSPPFLAASDPEKFEGDDDVIGKILSASDEGIHLSKGDCQDILGLVVGLVRDSSNNLLQNKVVELERSIVSSAKVIFQLRNELKEKEEVINAIKKETSAKNNKNFKINKKTYLDSESTLNESEDTIN